MQNMIQKEQFRYPEWKIKLHLGKTHIKKSFFPSGWNTKAW